MQLPSSGTHAREAGSFRPPGVTLSAGAAGAGDRTGSNRACGWIGGFIEGISCQKWYIFRSLARGYYTVGGPCSGSLYGDWIFRAQNRSRAGSRPGFCRRISKSRSFAPVTGPIMLSPLQAQRAKKSGICLYNRTPVC